MKKTKSKSPIDLSQNFKLVKARKKKRSKLLTVSVFFFLCLSVLFSSMFFMAQTNIGSEVKYHADKDVINQLPPDFRDDDPRLTDVNQIVLQKKRNGENYLSEKDFMNTKPVEVHVNYPPPKKEVVKKRVYKSDGKKLSEFFASAKTQNSSENAYSRTSVGNTNSEFIPPPELAHPDNSSGFETQFAQAENIQ